MSKKRFGLAALGIVALAFAFVVSFSAANSPASQKWEYLAVTPGKVYWSSVASKAEMSKDTAFREATELEQLLDKLGQQRWELVSIVGQIGGDQEFVFKRPIR